ncbi:MAG: PP2C family protein-serine/threonine phosphatase [Actinocrinis sp.]
MAILVAGVLVAVALTVLSRAAYAGNETRLLKLQGQLTAATLQADPLYVESHLGAAADLAAGTSEPEARFRQVLAGIVGPKGPFVSASLWDVGGRAPRLVSSMGSSPLLSPSSAAARRFVEEATNTTFAVERLTAPHQVHLGYAVVAGGAHEYAVYAEEPLPADTRIHEPASSPISRLNLAVYLDHGHKRVLIETDAAGPLPLRGQTTTQSIPFGNDKLTLVMSARGSLDGGLSPYTRWVIGVLVVLLSVIGALGAERLTRRRVRAEREANEVRERFLAQREIARTLQHSLLPETLPRREGFEFSARYLAGAEGVEVGGDWYDLVEVDEHRLFFAVGDVCGRGLQAAALMGNLRNAINAYAREGHPPEGVLSRLDPLLSVADGRFATVLCGLLDTRTGDVAVANAGHLPPLLIRATGPELVATALGPPVGVKGTDYGPTHFALGDDETLLIYTDGLVERRSEILTDGLERLRLAVRTGEPLEQLLDHVLEDLGAADAADDVAILAIRRGGPEARRIGEVGSPAPAPPAVRRG